MSVIDDLPEIAQQLPYHLYIANATPVNAIKQEAIDLLWHQRLIHCGMSSMKDLHKHVDGIPNLNHIKFNNIDKCAVFFKLRRRKMRLELEVSAIPSVIPIKDCI